ncbi:MAG: disulfide bond formation protein B [Acidobacteriota bacterium]
MKDTFYTLLSVAILVLLVPVGTSVFVLGFVLGDSPCVLCWAQRTGMVLIALIGLFILRYGPRPRYLGLVVLVGAYGIYMSIRHSALHLARDIGQGFSVEMLGAHTYSWSTFIYWACVVAAGLALLLSREWESLAGGRRLGLLGKIAAAVFFVVVAGNIAQAITSTGPPPFMGQSDPVRYSFNPRRWVWSLEEWRHVPISFRGRWSIDRPSLDGLDTDSRRGPLATVGELQVKRQETISPSLNGEVTDLAYDEASGRFLLTTQKFGIYLVDAAFKNVIRYTVIDPGFSVDMSELNGAAFVDSRTIAALSHNKSYVILKENDAADADKNYRYFAESFDQFDELDRSRFSTVRARMMYVMSLAYDPASDCLYTVTVPNRRNKKLVVSRFARTDMTLSEEYSPKLSAGSGPVLRDDTRSLGEYYVTGIAIRDGRMYAISAAYSTLLLIDLAKREVSAAYAVRGLSKPNGLAVRGTELYVACENKTVHVVDGPA